MSTNAPEKEYHRAMYILVHIPKKNQSSTRRTWILMGFIITTALLQGTNRKSHGQNSGLLEFL